MNNQTRCGLVRGARCCYQNFTTAVFVALRAARWAAKRRLPLWAAPVCTIRYTDHRSGQLVCGRHR